VIIASLAAKYKNKPLLLCPSSGQRDFYSKWLTQHAMVGTIIRAIRLPGIESENGHRIFGYADASSFVDYL